MSEQREQQAEPNPNQEPVESENTGDNSDDRRRAGGRTIGRWKRSAFAALPNASDEDIAQRINQSAKQEGYDNECSADLVARWRRSDSASRPGNEPPSNGEEHHADNLTPPPAIQERPSDEGAIHSILRQLVYLLGKDGVKKLIDSL